MGESGEVIQLDALKELAFKVINLAIKDKDLSFLADNDRRLDRRIWFQLLGIEESGGLHKGIIKKASSRKQRKQHNVLRSYLLHNKSREEILQERKERKLATRKVWISRPENKERVRRYQSVYYRKQQQQKTQGDNQ